MVNRGDLCWVDFGEPVGSEPAYRRPALVVSSDRFNRSRIATVIISAVTSNTRLAEMPGNVAVARGDGSLPKDGAVNVSQTMVVDRSRVLERIGTLPAHLMHRVDDGLRLILAL